MGRTVVITGASAGVSGARQVRAFAREGWSVGLLARGQDGLWQAAAEVEQLGTRALAVPTDVADATRSSARRIRSRRSLARSMSGSTTR
jgi:NADP-dependent 3-hydroxy acid dehydrogenase YdfG